MKKTFKIMISVLVIAITVLGFNFYGNHKTSVSKQKVSEFEVRDYYRLNGLVLVQKLDENGDLQNGVTLRLKSLDEEFTYTLRRKNGISEGVTRYNSGPPMGNYNLYLNDSISKEDYYLFLKPEQINIIDSIQTERDVQEKANDSYFCEINNIYDDNDNPVQKEHYCSIAYPTVFTLEETRVPTGYGKKKIILPAAVFASYSRIYDISEEISIDDEFDTAEFRVTVPPSGYYMEYGEVDINELLDSDFNKVARLWKTKGIKNNNCGNGIIGPGNLDMNQSSSNVEMLDSLKTISPEAFDIFDGICPIVLENERGETKLEVSSYVNNSEEITTNVNQVIDYKVVVKNTGDFDAVDNKVVSRLPDGFVYVEGSVSNGGRYENGAVTWDIARIEQGENLTLTYKAYAPKGANTFSSYVGETSVENFALENNKVEANKTYVKLSLTNPYTYTPIGILVLVLILSVIALTAAVQLKTKKK